MRSFFRLLPIVAWVLGFALGGIWLNHFVDQQRAIGARDLRLHVQDSALAVQATVVQQLQVELAAAHEQIAAAERAVKVAQHAQSQAYIVRDSVRETWDTWVLANADTNPRGCVFRATQAIEAERAAGSACDKRVAAESLRVIAADSARAVAETLSIRTAERMALMERQNVILRPIQPSAFAKTKTAGKWLLIGGGTVFVTCRIMTLTGHPC